MEASATLTPATHAPSLNVNFRGVDDSLRFGPADPQIAVGQKHVIQAVNSLFRITDKTGGSAVTVDPVDLFSAFFAANPDINPGPFDPWAVFDHFDNRFVIVWLTVADATLDKGFYLIQVSKTADPTQGWDLFSIRSDLNGQTDTDAPADYEKLGFDNTNFYLTSNQFTLFQSFAGTKVRVMKKSQFYAPTANPIEFFDFDNTLDANGEQSFTIQPCVTFGTPGKEFLVDAGFLQNYLTLYSITGTWPNAGNTPPVLAVEGKVNFSAWDVADHMPQPGTSILVDSLSDSLLNAVFRNGTVYTGHSIKAGGFNCAAGIKSINVATKTKVLDEVIGAAGDFMCQPVVTVDTNNNVYTVFNRSNSAVFPEIRYTVKTPADATFQASGVLKLGEAAQTTFRRGNVARWGDYNGIALDPVDGCAWINSMYGVNTASDNYGTWVGKICVQPPPLNNVTAAFDTGTRTLALTGDSENNNLTVTFARKFPLRNSTVTIAGVGGTKINGQAQAVFTVGNVEINLIANLAGGGDTVTFTSVQCGTANINLGEGADSITFRLCVVNNLTLDGGNGTDVLVKMTSLFRNSNITGIP